jgi:hypothetical protein
VKITEKEISEKISNLFVTGKCPSSTASSIKNASESIMLKNNRTLFTTKNLTSSLLKSRK